MFKNNNPPAQPSVVSNEGDKDICPKCSDCADFISLTDSNEKLTTVLNHIKTKGWLKKRDRGENFYKEYCRGLGVQLDD